MIYIFIQVIIGINLIEYIINRRMINVVSVFTIPYLLICVINNFFAYKYGFYKINDKVFLMLSIGFISIFTGSLLVNYRYRVSKIRMVRDISLNESIFLFYRMKAMIRFAFIAEAIVFIRLIRIVYGYGFKQLTSDVGIQLSGGIGGHVFLMIYPLLPILFFYWLQNKKDIIFLIVTTIGVFLAFMSFTKYHSIGLIIMIYLFVSLLDKKYLKIGAVILVGVVVALFVVNYVVGFMASNALGAIDSNFYIFHLWKYIAGSIIHDNNLFLGHLNHNVTYGHKILYCTFPIPNMFLKGLGFKMLDLKTHFPFDAISNIGENTNVIDFVGYMYPAGEKGIAIIGYILIMISVGALVSVLYNRAIRHKTKFPITICVVLTFFCFLSFFGIFASLSVPWEIIIWSLLIPQLFDRRVKIYF